MKSKKKDENGWRSPCVVVAKDGEGNIDYKWQGQILKAPAHMTRAMAPDLQIFNLSESGTDLVHCEEIRLLMEYTERLENNSAQMHGTMISNGEERLSEAAEKNQMEMMKLAYHVAV